MIRERRAGLIRLCVRKLKNARSCPARSCYCIDCLGSYTGYSWSFDSDYSCGFEIDFADYALAFALSFGLLAENPQE
jgi:hypothetical protein